MKIKSLEIKDYHPIKNLKMDNLGSVVIIAGANGSGKTRLKKAIVDSIQSTPVMELEIVATRRDEEEPKYFNGKYISLKKGQPNQLLQNYINSRKYSSAGYVGSLVQIDSNRNVTALKYAPVNWLGGDPDDSEAVPKYYFNNFSSRWSDFVNYIHQKLASRDKKISDEVKRNPSVSGQQIIDKHPDPFQKYKEIFSTILPGKELQDIKPEQPGEFQYRDVNGAILPFSTLSSGEQEVVKVLFDVARKDIRHSIVIVDEPELHLHPTLTFKLIEALKSIGDHSNQFFFLTHSADLISTYYSSGDVYFIDSIQTGSNQAHKLSDLNHSHKEIVNLIGQNLGVFAVGKKLIFVEGESSSVDRLTYHTIAQTVLPEAKIIPIGSVSSLMVLNAVESQIRSSIFGIDIYMIRDRDGLSEVQIQELESKGKIRCLKKRHIENYFLDAEILFNVAEQLYLTSTSTVLSVAYIEDQMQIIAENSLNYNLMQNAKEYLGINHSFGIPSVKSVETKGLEDVQAEMISSTIGAITKLKDSLSEDVLNQWMRNESSRLQGLLKDKKWKDEFQGKFIFNKVCADVLKEDAIRVRQAFVDLALKNKREVFSDLLDAFESFK